MKAGRKKSIYRNSLSLQRKFQVFAANNGVNAQHDFKEMQETRGRYNKK